MTSSRLEQFVTSPLLNRLVLISWYKCEVTAQVNHLALFGGLLVSTACEDCGKDRK